jgi:hypothetical protein
MVAEMELLEQVCIIFLDGLPTVNRSCVRHLNPVLRVERGQGGCIAVVECLVIFFTERVKLLACGSAASFCWAKIGKAKLIANPTRATTKRISIVSSGGSRTICHLTTCCGIVSDSPGAERTSLVKGPEGHLKWTPRPIRCQ